MFLREEIAVAQTSPICTVFHHEHNAKFFVQNADDLIQQCFVKGHFFDSEELEDLLHYVKQDAVVLDIGANVGNHTVFFATVGRAQKVIPFEVNPDAHELLARNVELNGLNNVDLSFLGLGLGRESGRIVLKHSRENNLGATSFGFASEDCSNQKQGFPVEPLDDVLGRDYDVEFIKLDVEGMEFEVLEGAKELIQRCKPLVFLENFGWAAGIKLLAWLGENNYRIAKKYGPNYLVMPRDPGQAISKEIQKKTGWDRLASVAAQETGTVSDLLFEISKKCLADPFIMHAIAEIFLKLGDAKRAAWTIKRAKKNTREGFLALLQTEAEVASLTGEQRGELAALNHAAQLAPHDVVIAERLSDLQWKAGDYSGALKSIGDFVARNWGCARAHHWKSTIAERAGNLPEALKHARLAIELNPPDVASLKVRLADLLRVSGASLDDALTVVDQAIGAGQTSAWAFQVKSVILESKGDERGALAYAYRARKADGGNSNHHDSRIDDLSKKTKPTVSTVGIVVVSYNAPKAVRLTLASLHESINLTPYKLLLIDNASEDLARQEIRDAFDRHVGRGARDWEYVQLDRNLGFSGGNNIGITRFLQDPEISHICLLNSDVVVPDRWLDQLASTGGEIVSAVTNRAESEQCIPTDYRLDMEECLDGEAESMSQHARARINEFARDWHELWAGNLVEADVTFFCVLIANRVFHQVGLLDEEFFPGGYEDDDYCLRARKKNYGIHIARDVFVHHWGSASFGQLEFSYFHSQSDKNRRYLEKKHGILVRRRAEKPFVSYLLDLRFAFSREMDLGRLRRFNALYCSHLGSMLQHYESEFRNLREMLARSGVVTPNVMQEQIEQAASHGNLEEVWRDIASETEAAFSGAACAASSRENLLSRLERLIDGVQWRVECNFAMHALLYPAPNELDESAQGVPDSGTGLPPAAGNHKLSKLWWILSRGLQFVRNLRGVVFFGGYPYPERLSDGYFQRIKSVDSLFSDQWRVYVESDELPGRNLWFDRPQPKVLVLRISGGRRRRMFVRALALVAVLKCRKIYFHSVLRMRDNRFGRLMHVPGLLKTIDIHGVVPEEFRLHNDFYSAVLYEREELLAVRKSDMVIVVTDAMHNYLRQKYREHLRGEVSVFPMFPNIAPTLAPRAYVDGKPVVVYAGGLHKWQQVPKMIDAISRTASICAYRFYCPDPDSVRTMLPAAVTAEVTVDRKSHDELIALYPECHYGFILREDIVVNHVACPTKLVEYLGMGIVPIVDSENMGDFGAMGMQFVSLNNLLQGNLPGEAQRAEMARLNFAIYQHIREVRKKGAEDIRALLAGYRRTMRPPRFERLKALLPADTRRGHVARWVWGGLKVSPAILRSIVSDLPNRGAKGVAGITSSDAPECQVLVQVENFEAGGLENVVLDLSDTLLGGGYKVVLLVLGRPGAAVEQARQRGVPILVGSAERDSYRALLDRLNPRILLSHYSVQGAELCRERGIPFVQVIHNIYMWFDDRQRKTFSETARLTTVFVAVSECARDYSIRRLGVEQAGCLVIRNGIDSAAFDSMDTHSAREEIRRKHGLCDQDFVFLSVGAINHQKNHIATVRAFASVAHELPDSKLVIVGPPYEPSLLAEIEQFVIDRGLGGRVLYAGPTSVAHKYYAMADAFVSAAFFEGGGLNHLEAAKANLPSIMSRVGYAWNFVNLPGFEIVEPPVDIAEFRGEIWQLGSTPQFERNLGEAMIRTYRDRCRPNLPANVLETFDKVFAYQAYIELIEHLLQGRGINQESLASSWPILGTSKRAAHASAAI